MIKKNVMSFFRMPLIWMYHSDFLNWPIFDFRQESKKVFFQIGGLFKQWNTFIFPTEPSC